MRKKFTSFVVIIFTFLLGMSAQEAPGFYTVWSKAKADVSYMLSTSQKTMALHDGNLYIVNAVTGKNQRIDVVSTEDASLKKTIVPRVAIKNSYILNSIAISDDGAVLTGSSLLGGDSLYIYKWTNLEADSATCTALPAVAAKGRIDYFSVHGDFDSAKGGYIGGFSMTQGGYLNIAPVSNGVIGKMTTYEGVMAAAADAAMDFINDSTVILGARNTPKGIFKLSESTATEIKGTGSGIPNGRGVPSSAYFRFKGYDYVVSTETCYGGLKVIDITDGATNAVTLHEVDSLYRSFTMVTPVCVDVKSDHVMIYHLIPNVSLFAYKFVPEKQIEGTVAAPVITPETGDFKDTITVSISTSTPDAVIRYTLDGSVPTESSAEYTAPFELVKLEADSVITVKSNAWLANWKTSEVAEVTYTFIILGIGEDSMSLAKVYSANGQIVVETETATDVEIYNLQGQKYISDEAVFGITKYSLEKGVYIVRIGDKSVKVVL